MRKLAYIAAGVIGFVAGFAYYARTDVLRELVIESASWVCRALCLAVLLSATASASWVHYDAEGWNWFGGDNAFACQWCPNTAENTDARLPADEQGGRNAFSIRAPLGEPEGWRNLPLVVTDTEIALPKPNQSGLPQPYTFLTDELLEPYQVPTTHNRLGSWINDEARMFEPGATKYMYQTFPYQTGHRGYAKIEAFQIDDDVRYSGQPDYFPPGNIGWKLVGWGHSAIPEPTSLLLLSGGALALLAVRRRPAACACILALCVTCEASALDWVHRDVEVDWETETITLPNWWYGDIGLNDDRIGNLLAIEADPYQQGRAVVHGELPELDEFIERWDDGARRSANALIDPTTNGYLVGRFAYPGTVAQTPPYVYLKVEPGYQLTAWGHRVPEPSSCMLFLLLLPWVAMRNRP